jgi:hypothetical protein
MSNDKEGEYTQEIWAAPTQNRRIRHYEPWITVCVDLVGPFTIRTPAKTYSLLALTMIDPATGWLEIIKATNKSATSIQDLFHNTLVGMLPTDIP